MESCANNANTCETALRLTAERATLRLLLPAQPSLCMETAETLPYLGGTPVATSWQCSYSYSASCFPSLVLLVLLQAPSDPMWRCLQLEASAHLRFVCFNPLHSRLVDCNTCRHERAGDVEPSPSQSKPIQACQAFFSHLFLEKFPFGSTPT